MNVCYIALLTCLIYTQAYAQNTFNVTSDVYERFIGRLETWRNVGDPIIDYQPQWWRSLNSCKGVVYNETLKKINIPAHGVAVATVTTITHGPQLRTWRKYYGKQFGHENLFIGVIVSGKVKNFLSGDAREAVSQFRFSPELGAAYAKESNLIATSCGKGYKGTVYDSANEMYTLLRSLGYRVIIFTDDDEFLVPDVFKYPNGLIQYVEYLLLDSSRPPWARAHGYNIREVDEDASSSDMPLEKSFFDRSKSVFEQRARWFRGDPYYCKCLISATPWLFASGQHEGRPIDEELIKKYGTQTLGNCSENADQDLALVHLKCVERSWLKDQTFREYAIEDRETRHRWVVNATIHTYESRWFDDFFKRAAWHAPVTCGWPREKEPNASRLRLIPERFKTSDL